MKSDFQKLEGESESFKNYIVLGCGVCFFVPKKWRDRRDSNPRPPA